VKIEAGKFYKTRDGSKVGPAIYRPVHGCFQAGRDWLVSGCRYYEDGTPFGRKDAEWALDLISEWTDEPTGPVITETVKRIVPGTYGIVTVYSNHSTEIIARSGYTAAELRAAAATLTEIAEALEEMAS
jgi:hypothetical protein